MTLLHFIRQNNILIEPCSSGCWLTWGSLSAKFHRRRHAIEWCELARKATR